MRASAGRVLILVENLSVPFDQRVWREASALTEVGYAVSVICPKGKKFDTCACEEIDGVSIYRYNGYEARAGLIAYIYEYLQAIIKMLFLSIIVCFRKGFDVIQICNPPDLLFLVALPFKLLGKKIVFDQHDLSPETYLSKKEGVESGCVHRILLWLEKMTFRCANMVIVTNDSYREMAIARGKLGPEKVVVVRNGPDLKQISAVEADRARIRGHGQLILYVGNIGSQDGVDYLLRAIHYLRHEQRRDDFHVLIVGGGTNLETLKRYAEELRIDDVVHFTGPVVYRDVVEALFSADICVCPDPKSPLNDISTMIKTLEYMAAGKPLVAFDLKETRVSAGEAALYARPNDEKDFRDKIATLLDNPELRTQLGTVGQDRIRNGLSWDYSRDKLYDVYERTLNAGSNIHRPGIKANPVRDKTKSV